MILFHVPPVLRYGRPLRTLKHSCPYRIVWYCVVLFQTSRYGFFPTSIANPGAPTFQLPRFDDTRQLRFSKRSRPPRSAAQRSPSHHYTKPLSKRSAELGCGHLQSAQAGILFLRPSTRALVCVLCLDDARSLTAARAESSVDGSMDSSTNEECEGVSCIRSSFGLGHQPLMRKTSSPIPAAAAASSDSALNYRLQLRAQSQPPFDGCKQALHELRGNSKEYNYCDATSRLCHFEGWTSPAEPVDQFYDALSDGEHFLP